MTLPKAMDILTVLSKSIYDDNLEDSWDAIKLGIEALKAYKILRSPGSPYYPHVLPGETKE